MIKYIHWSEQSSGNIQTVNGSIDGLIVFNIVRFNNKAFPNENWVMTSHVIPMDMNNNVDLDVLKLKANDIIESFVNKLIQ
jgi:hypothetical protein